MQVASMRSRGLAGLRALLVGVCGVTLSATAAPVCQADSGRTRAALVELYTSEGCSSCPPADKALMRFGHASGPVAAGTMRVVPLALHVDYWDSIGWKDPYAQAAFTDRQGWEVRANRHRTSYTPHFFVNGRELEDWRSDLARASSDGSGGPAPARLQVRAEREGANALHVKVDGSVDGAPGRTLQLYVAVTENGLVSQVGAGENRGVRLEHDHVVRNWIGPIAVQGGRVSLERVIDLPGFGHNGVAVTAFLQDASTADVLQAVGTDTCTAS